MRRIYESDLISDKIRAIIGGAIRTRTTRIEAKLKDAIALHPPRTAFDPRSVADLHATIFEGAFVMTRTLPDADIMLDQLRHDRCDLELLFGAEIKT